MSSRRNGDDVAAAGGWQYIFGPSSERVDKIPAAATIRSCVARATSVYYDPAQHTFEAGRVTGYTASSQLPTRRIFKKQGGVAGRDLGSTAELGAARRAGWGWGAGTRSGVGADAVPLARPHFII